MGNLSIAEDIKGLSTNKQILGSEALMEEVKDIGEVVKKAGTKLPIKIPLQAYINSLTETYFFLLDKLDKYGLLLQEESWLKERQVQKDMRTEVSEILSNGHSREAIEYIVEHYTF